MQASKRSWIYGGLAHPAKAMAAQRAPKRRLLPGSTLILTGDRHAWGLAPFIKQLCADLGIRFYGEFEPKAPTCLERWSVNLAPLVRTVQPDLVLVSLLPCHDAPDRLQQALVAVAVDARSHGATLVWLRPPGPEAMAFRVELDRARIPSFHSEALQIPRTAAGDPTTRGYAGWAGALWRWIG